MSAKPDHIASRCEN